MGFLANARWIVGFPVAIGKNLKFSKVRVQGSKGLAGLFFGFQGLKFVNNPTRLQDVALFMD